VTLDAELAALIAQTAPTDAVPYWTLTPAEVRRDREQMSQQGDYTGLVVEDIDIDGPAGPMLVRVYRKEGLDQAPAVLFFHGSGWVICSVNTHDALVASLARASECVWVSVEYRLAPEAKFPSAIEDAYAATVWVANNAKRLGIDADCIAVAGDSAGANLAAVVCLLARERTGPAIKLQVLAYPVCDTQTDRESYARNAPFGLNADGMGWYLGHYLTTPTEASDWRVAPVRAESLAGLPPAIVLVAELDVLYDEGIEYANRLAADGVDVALRIETGMPHGFWSRPISRARASVLEVGSTIGARLRQDSRVSGRSQRTVSPTTTVVSTGISVSPTRHKPTNGPSPDVGR
jgi:acetyl esterase